MAHFWMSRMTIILITTINTVASLENVAVGKVASQSGSFYSYSTADKAVDGNNNPRMEDGSCAHPDTSRLPSQNRNPPPAWWRLGLGTSYDVYQVVVVNRNYYKGINVQCYNTQHTLHTDTRALSGDNYGQAAWWKVDLGASYDVYQVLIVNRHISEDLISDTWVTVSDEKDVTPNDTNICNEIIHRSRLGEINETVNCSYKDRNPPLRGRYVTITRKDDANVRHWTNFCEVEVLSCPPGRWRKDLTNGDCSVPCGRCIEETCRVSDGYCYTGCQDGFWGEYCDNQCDCQQCDRFTGCPVEATTTTTATEKQAVDRGGVNIGLIVGMVVLSIALIIAVIMLNLLYKRYKKLQQNPPTDISMETQRPEAAGLSNPQNITVYDEISEYEELKQNKQEKHYENNEVVEKIYVSLKPVVMETIRDHIQSTNNQQLQQQPRYQNVSLPEPVYDQVYAGCQPNPISFRNVKNYVNHLKEQIEKFSEEYKEEVEVLYTALIDVLETVDTAIPSSQFSNVYNSLQKINTDTFKSTLHEQYQILEMIKPLDDRTLKSGLLPENIAKNRNRDIIPNDRFRAVLRTSANGNPDYINAVVVMGYNEGENYILTQSPLKETVADLWRLVNENNSSTIVMLNKISHDQEQNNAAVVYWPPEIGTAMEFGRMTVSNNGYHVDSKNKNVYITQFELSIEDFDYVSKQMKIKQFSIKEWNQSTLIRDFIRLIELIEKWQSKASSQSEPIIIHCLNGAERSGLFCVALYVAKQIKTQQKVDIFSAVKHVRLYRPQCINNTEQYNFLHEFAQEFIKRQKQQTEKF